MTTANRHADVCLVCGFIGVELVDGEMAAHDDRYGKACDGATPARPADSRYPGKARTPRAWPRTDRLNGQRPAVGKGG